MHPVEQLIYLTRSFLPLVFTLHPVHFLCKCSRSLCSSSPQRRGCADAKIRAELSPAPGHSGFSTHGGSQQHYIHHARFEFNYGAGPIGTTLGQWFGSYKAA